MALLYFRWTFFITQWTDRIEEFKNEVRLNLAADQVIRGTMLILTIVLHDCIYKFLRIFWFSRYKPAGLQMTSVQLVGPIFDILVVFLSLLIIVKEFHMILTIKEPLLHKERFSCWPSFKLILKTIKDGLPTVHTGHERHVSFLYEFP